MLGYGVGPGKLKLGARAVELAAPTFGKLAGPIGHGLEGGVAGVGGTLGHGDYNPWDLAKAFGVGAGIGGLVGMIPGGRGANAGEDVGSALKADKDARWADLQTFHFDPSDIKPSVDNITNNRVSNVVTGQGQRLIDQANKITDEATNAGAGTPRKLLSGNDLAEWQLQMNEAAAKSKNPLDLVARQSRPRDRRELRQRDRRRRRQCDAGRAGTARARHEAFNRPLTTPETPRIK